jgi:hypothetical protein
MIELKDKEELIESVCGGIAQAIIVEQGSRCVIGAFVGGGSYLISKYAEEQITGSTNISSMGLLVSAGSGCYNLTGRGPVSLIDLGLAVGVPLATAIFDSLAAAPSTAYVLSSTDRANLYGGDYNGDSAATTNIREISLGDGELVNLAFVDMMNMDSFSHMFGAGPEDYS